MLMRAGFGRPLAAGVFGYLPAAKRSLDKVSAILREEMEACGGQEASMPVVHPAEIWERSGRYSSVGPDLGDMELNETKLTNAVGAGALRPVREEEIWAVGAEVGYAAPVGLRHVLVVADDEVALSPNLVVGANEEGFHLLDVNLGRDFEADVVADLAAAEEGSACPECGAPMRDERRGEVGNVFKLGTGYAEAAGATFWTRTGGASPL
jgi:prolyl-tRNA synthetase